MNLWRVTLTGADDRTSHDEMLEISREFKHVEWGILFHQSKVGQFRYPTFNWIDKLSSELTLSAHLCGQFVTSAMRGKFIELEQFQRIQLNFHKKRLQEALTCQPLEEAIKASKKDVIFGGNFKNVEVCATDLMPNIQILYDGSGGHGILSEEWEIPAEGMDVGYAGGLNPDNLEEQLAKIEEVVGERHVWVDMESGVRTDDVFDLNKVRRCLEICSKYFLGNK